MEPRLSRHDDVLILDLGEGENRFNPTSISRLGATIDEVAAIAAAGDKVGLVTTGTGKFYSNGLDLEWMLNEAGLEERGDYLPSGCKRRSYKSTSLFSASRRSNASLVSRPPPNPVRSPLLPITR